MSIQTGEGNAASTALSEQARAWLDPAVDFVLERGLAGLTLRPLAVALGTSDRMVIYHFGSKERLVAQIVARASERLALTIGAQLSPVRATPSRVVHRFWSAMTAPATMPYIQLYVELWSAAAREPEAYAAAVQQISSGWLALVQQMFRATGKRIRPGAAIDTLAFLDGLILVRGAMGGTADTEAAVRRFAAGL
jgi:AcrR family transcriptional regulator